MTLTVLSSQLDTKTVSSRNTRQPDHSRWPTHARPASRDSKPTKASQWSISDATRLKESIWMPQHRLSWLRPPRLWSEGVTLSRLPLKTQSISREPKEQHTLQSSRHPQIRSHMANAGEKAVTIMSQWVQTRSRCSLLRTKQFMRLSRTLSGRSVRKTGLQASRWNGRSRHLPNQEAINSLMKIKKTWSYTRSNRPR